MMRLRLSVDQADLVALLGLAGVALLGAGLWMVYMPLAFIVLGLLLCGLALWKLR